MAPLQDIPILGRRKILLFRSPTYGLLVGAISGQGPQAWLQEWSRDNLDSGRIFAPNVYSNPTRITAPPQAIPILVRGKILLFRCPLVVSWWVQYLAKGPRLDFIVHGLIWTMATFWPQRLFESNWNNGSSPGHSSLGTLKITTACPFDFFPA